MLTTARLVFLLCFVPGVSSCQPAGYELFDPTNRGNASQASPPVVPYLPLSSAATNLLTATFNDNSTAGWRFLLPGWRVEQGVMKGQNLASAISNEAVWVAGSEWTDYSITAKIRLSTLNPISSGGLFFRYANEKSFGGCQLLVDDRARTWLHLFDASGSPGRQAAATLASQQWFTIKVTVEGNNASCEIDGQPSTRMTSALNLPRAGTIALKNAHIEVWFDDVIVNGTTGSQPPPSPACLLSCSASAPATGETGKFLAFSSSVSANGCSGSPTAEWEFGDGGRASGLNPTYAYDRPGTFNWTFRARLAGTSDCVKNGSVRIVSPAPQIQTVRIEEIDEDRSPRAVTSFPGEQVILYYKVVKQDGTPLALSGSNVTYAVQAQGFSPPDKSVGFSLLDGGVLAVSVNSGALGIPALTSGAKLGLKSGAGVLRVDSETFNVSAVPPAVAFSVGAAPPHTDIWDVYGESGANASLGLGAEMPGVRTLPLSLQLAEASLGLNGGVGLRIARDYPSRDLTLERRFSLGLTARLQAPSISIGKTAREGFSPTLGVSVPALTQPAAQGLSAGISVSGGVFHQIRLPGSAPERSRLLAAAFTLETMAISGTLVNPAAGLLLRAAVDGLTAAAGVREDLKNSTSELGVTASAEGDIGAALTVPVTPAFSIETAGALSGAAEIRKSWLFENGDNQGSRLSYTVAGSAEGALVPSGLLSRALPEGLKGGAAGYAGTSLTEELKFDASGQLVSMLRKIEMQREETRLDLAFYEKTDALRTRRIFSTQDPQLLRRAAAYHTATSGLLQFAGGRGRLPAQALALIDGLSDLAETLKEPDRSTRAFYSKEVERSRFRRANVSVGLGSPAGIKATLGIEISGAYTQSRRMEHMDRFLYQGGREWLLRASPVTPGSAPEIEDVLSRDLLPGFSALSSAALERLKSSTQAMVESGRRLLLRLKSRLTGDDSAEIEVDPVHAGKTISVECYSADRPEAVQTKGQAVSQVRWQYSTSRLSASRQGAEAESWRRRKLTLISEVVSWQGVAGGGANIVRMNPPLKLSIPLDSARIAKAAISPDLIADAGIYRYIEGQAAWQRVGGGLSGDGGKIVALIEEPGSYAAGVETVPDPADTDGDGLPDRDEDFNQDGIIDAGESHPLKADSDEDGVDDLKERQSGTDPLDPDSHPNRPPVLAYVPNRVAIVNESVSWQLAGYDPDDDALRFSVSPAGAIPGLSYEPGTGEIRWRPNVAGQWRATFTVSDGELDASQTVLLTSTQGACAYSLQEPPPVLSKTGGLFSLSVRTGAGCSWKAFPLVDWIITRAGQSGTGSSAVQLEALPNPGAQPRTGKIQIETVSFDITQAGSDPNPTQVKFWADPNPILLPAGKTLGKTLLRWEAPLGVTRVDVRVLSATGKTLPGGSAPPTGSVSTGEWVTDGMTFYLVDLTPGLPADPPRILATVTVAVKAAGDQPAPPPVNPPDPAILASFDFSSTRLDGWQTWVSGWFVQDGVLKATNKTPGVRTEAVWSGGYGWTDYTVSAKVNLRGSYAPASAEVRFRYVDDKHYGSCMLLQDYSEWRLVLAQGTGVIRSMVIPNLRGKDATLHVQASGAVCTVSVEGRGIGSLMTIRGDQVTIPASGTIALRNAHEEVWFDDVTVRRVTSGTNPAPSPAPSLQEGFDNPSLAGWTSWIPNWIVHDGWAKATNKQPNVRTELAWAGGFEWKNYFAATDVVIIGSYAPASAELRFRYRDERNYGSCQLQQDYGGWRLLLLDSRGTVSSSSLRNLRGTRLRLQAEIRDDRASCTVSENGVALASVNGTVQTPLTGTVAIRNAHEEVWFDNVRVWQ